MNGRVLPTDHTPHASASSIDQPSKLGQRSFLADVAQLVEQRFRKPQVKGSNPFVGSVESLSEYEKGPAPALDRGRVKPMPPIVPRPLRVVAGRV